MLSVVFQYKAPVSNGLPSLSTVGGVALAPRYLSSKESYEAAALLADVAADAALVAASVAEVAALAADVAADVAEVAAADAELDAVVA